MGGENIKKVNNVIKKFENSKNLDILINNFSIDSLDIKCQVVEMRVKRNIY